MKIKPSFRVLCFGFALLTTSSAIALEGPWYVGIKAGQVMVDLSEYGDATNAGVVVGFDVNEAFAIEGEFTTTVSDGDLTVLGVTGEWNIDTVALYGVFRSRGDIYFKAKAGYLNEDVTASIVGVSISGSDSGASYGVGIGWQLANKHRIELEYTIIESDADFLSIGYYF